MFINLNNINEKGIILDQDIEFEESFYKNTVIKGIKNAHVKGKIYYSSTKEVMFEGNVKGEMLIIDSNTGDIVSYPFLSEINEILYEDTNLDENLRSNSQNSLDLKQVLWQNIVLEVPLRFSKTDKPAVTEGDGWKLKSEFDKKEDSNSNPFMALLDTGKE